MPEGLTGVCADMHTRLVGRARTSAAGLFVAALIVSVLGVLASATTAYAADTIPPTIPLGATATTGAAPPLVAHVAWQPSTDNFAVAGYYIYRAVALAGPYTRIGSSAGNAYDDQSGVVGKVYWYKVGAFDAGGNESAQSAATNQVTALWTVTPHSSYSGTDLCGSCHAPHRALTSHDIFRNASTAQGELSTCYACHDGTSASTNIKAGPVNSFALSSGHVMESLIDTTTPSDLANSCSDCHTPHKDYNLRPLLWKSQVNTTTVTGANTTWCLGCHNDAEDWYVGKYGSTYPTLTPTLDASGFPTAGTFTGRSIYTSATANAHSAIPTSGPDRASGDCRYCHATHRGPAKYDALLATYTVPTTNTLSADRANGDYAASCFACHDGGSWAASGAVNVKQFATYSGAADSAYSGHRIKSATPSAPVNAPLPCFACHNPHGSGRGNSNNVSDVLGKGLDASTGATGANVRRFCLSCHATSDSYVWNSNTATWAAVTATDKVFGLQRNGGAVNSGPGGVGFNWLLLKSTTGHSKDESNTACYDCHGKSYSASNSNNVHDPSAGLSNGGANCYSCHDYSAMDMGSAAKTNSYHHVLGTSTVSPTGDWTTMVASLYPTSTGNLFCISCHVDHNVFNGSSATSPSANLRTDIGAAATATNTDFSGTFTNGGICMSCHTQVLAKDTANQASSANSSTADAATRTIPLNKTDYDNSAHQYAVNTTFTNSVFRADCAKCHTDTQTYTIQDGIYDFGTHWGPVRRLLAPMGGTPVDPAGEKTCFRCHSRSGDAVGGTGKATNGYDWYGSLGSTMSAVAEYTFQNFYGASVVSSHPVNTSKVDCANCHNVHLGDRLTTKTADPDNTLAGYKFSLDTTAAQVAFCLKCHDGAPPVYKLTSSPATAYVPATVTVTISGGNKSLYRTTSHWEASGSIAATQTQSCATCHDSHGSKLPKLLGAYSGAAATNTINGVGLAGNDRTVCYACHTVASTGFSSPSENASGYPTDGTWPGAATYTVSYSPANHTGNIHQNATWPAEPTLSGGDCKVCHDVHGTANQLDELRDDDTSGGRGVFKYSPSNFGFCFNCHKAGGGSVYNIQQFYPVAASGTADVASLPRAGHRTLSAGTLAAGSALPCYDCHNPHGNGTNSPWGLLVVTQTGTNATTVIGDAPGEIVMTATPSPDAVRKFCFTCHTTGDSSPATLTMGWNGSGYATVTAGKVEGIDRTVYSASGAHLKLPPVNGHKSADIDSCYKCHGGAANGPSNVHNPTGGVSGGGESCYGCHSSYKDPMDVTGASRTSSYHHVMGGTFSGDIAPNAGTYPVATSTTATDVYCVSCHADHNAFNSNKPANLRSNIASSAYASIGPTNTDFVSSRAQGWGICLSCHAVQLGKDSANQLSDASTQTLSIDATAYAASAHNYSAPSTITGSGVFRGNCSKCHDDGQASSFQTGPNTFGTHYSAERRIAAAMGATVTAGTSSSSLCYHCHSTTNNPNGSAGKDYYGASSMTTHAIGINLPFGLASDHPIGANATAHRAIEGTSAGWNQGASRHVECEDCHDPHAAASGTTTWPALGSLRATNAVPAIAGSLKSVWGVGVNATDSADWNGGAVATGSPVAPTYSRLSDSKYQWQVCLKCHSVYAWSGGATPTVSLNQANQTGGKQTDVGKDFSPKNSAYHPIFAVGQNQPPTNANAQWASNAGRRNDLGTTGGLSNTFTDGWLSTSRVVCTDCHNNSDETGPSGVHGSSQQWILEGCDVNIKVTIAGGTVTYPNATAAAGNYCLNCHRADVYGNGVDANVPAYPTMSRISHSVAFHPSAGQCGSTGLLGAALKYASCLNCHGGRKDTSSYGSPTNAVVQSGAIHGSSMAAGPLGGDAMGGRFLNGASWSGHTRTLTTATYGCATLGAAGAAADNYSSCTNHFTLISHPIAANYSY